MNLDEAMLLVAQSLPRQWATHSPQPKQAEFMALGCQEALFGGAAGGGKSDALLQDTLQYVDLPGFSAILFRRTHTDLALPGALMDRSHEWLSGSPAHWNGIDKRWEFPSGATLSFGYLDGPRDHFRYQSAEFNYIGFDELSQFAENQYRYLFSRLRRTIGSDLPAKVRGATNPGAPWVAKRFGIPETVEFARTYEHEGRVFIPSGRSDNKFIDHEQYEQALSQLGSVEYDQLARGLWVSDSSGLVYRDLSETNLVDRLPPLPSGEVWTYLFSADFGVTDPTAFAVLAFTTHEPDVYVVESEEWGDLAPSDAAQLQIAWTERYGGFECVIGDTGGLGKAFEAEWRQRFAIPIEAADKQNKLGFVKLMNGDLKHGRLKIVRSGNEKLYEHMRELPWKSTEKQIEHPSYPNHLPDAVLYGWRKARHWQIRDRPREPEKGSKEWNQKQRDLQFEKRLKRNRQLKEENYYGEYY